eukprot:6035900-Amphidinium_carterae.2
MFDSRVTLHLLTESLGWHSRLGLCTQVSGNVHVALGHSTIRDGHSHATSQKIPTGLLEYATLLEQPRSNLS